MQPEPANRSWQHVAICINARAAGGAAWHFLKQ
jgi:hypothetical protein